MYFIARISFLWLLICANIINAQLTPNFYARSCPKLHNIVRTTMALAVAREPRMGASILRLFFHDCFVNGCDGSVLLEDTPAFKGEKNAYANQNSLKGFKLIDIIKKNVEAKCKNTVSCSDILALAARDGVVLLGGPRWTVPLGRRDARFASLNAANVNLPPPTANLATLISIFASKNLTARDMTALSGAHTIGMARCSSYRSHIYNEANNINAGFVAARMSTCPSVGGDDNLAPLDMNTPNQFDNSYFRNLMARQGLLHSDQELFNGGSQDAWVRLYAKSNYALAQDFTAAMIKMGNISPLTGFNGEIRRHCRFVN
ncbi:peroxidase P7-like [Chenopodium quinoa]|uniref:Peroxidase n=1 Tax=Chenopodium quinoa TaxID=63459 RepID=A0A803M6H8_CHEQI|nr:peroxidase P7-like [Chenopodium quinoa]